MTQTRSQISKQQLSKPLDPAVPMAPRKKKNPNATRITRHTSKRKLVFDPVSMGAKRRARAMMIAKRIDAVMLVGEKKKTPVMDELIQELRKRAYGKGCVKYNLFLVQSAKDLLQHIGIVIVGEFEFAVKGDYLGHFTELMVDALTEYRVATKLRSSTITEDGFNAFLTDMLNEHRAFALQNM